MAKATHAVPEGHHTVTPQLTCENAAEAIAWYVRALGAEEIARAVGPDGKVMHAEVRVGDSLIMLADANPAMDVRSPKSIGGTPMALHVYVDDVDGVFGRAMESGAKQLRPVENQFYGDRSGSFEDPFGHHWNIATHVEDVPPGEMAERAAAAMAAG